MKPVFFATPSAFRAWLERHHDSARELLVGFHKKGSGRPSITWPESVDQALCFGWIDGVRKSIDDTSYTIRFTPRRPRSIWSAVNKRRVEELIRQRLMHPAGRRAFENRTEDRSGIYSYEQRYAVKLDPAYERRFRANQPAWAFFRGQPAGLSKDRRVLGHEREEGGNATAASGHADGGLRAPANHRAPDPSAQTDVTVRRWPRPAR